jgi:hypothetical protein
MEKSAPYLPGNETYFPSGNMRTIVTNYIFEYAQPLARCPTPTFVEMRS